MPSPANDFSSITKQANKNDNNKSRFAGSVFNNMPIDYECLQKTRHLY
jgi:hypothetical protein